MKTMPSVNNGASYRRKAATTAALGLLFLLSAGMVQAESTSASAANLTRADATPHIAPPAASPLGWRFKLGVGALAAPAFLGAKEYQIIALPNVTVAYNDLFFASVKEGIGYNVVHANGWRVGPFAKYAFARKEDDSNPFRVGGDRTTALRGLGNVDGTLEFGGFAEYRHESFAYKVELRQGIDGHKGMIGEVSMSYADAIRRSGPPIVYAIGPRATFADADYINAYFGINQTQSVRSGLPPYTAGGGFVTYGVSGFLSLPLVSPVSVSIFAGYDHVGHEVADAPLIKHRGNDNQVTFGLGVTYAFDL
jgi:outer membrane protein